MNWRYLRSDLDPVYIDCDLSAHHAELAGDPTFGSTDEAEVELFLLAVQEYQELGLMPQVRPLLEMALGFS